MPEAFRLTRPLCGHLVAADIYDHDVNLIWRVVEPIPGYQLNGHRADCRCVPCRPDIVRLPVGPDVEGGAAMEGGSGGN